MSNIDCDAVQKRMDDNLERERVARVNRTDAAIDKAMADRSLSSSR